ncbi:MAG TPA: alpha/beta hydrolase, partial [Rudaea sp.]|nr:alpha/beta hydrolase [Rudaea sp.]
MRGDGPPIVLLHAGGDSIASTFGAQLAPFSAHHRVIALEQVGHGHTPDLHGPLTYAGMMKDTAALLEQLQIRSAGVVGLSDGAILALMLAARRPELVGSLVASGANVEPDGIVPEQIAYLKSRTGNGDDIGDKLGRLWL